MDDLPRRRFLAGLAGAIGSAALAGGTSLARALTRSGLAIDRDLICRPAWGARKPTHRMREHTIRRITVHHSGVKLTDNRKAPARFRSHQRAHQARGWADIAYHILIDRRGNVYRGRRASAVGDTATDYDPKGHLLVMCEGNFDAQRPSGSQVDALVDVLAWACDRYGVAVDRISGHRRWAHTACPGRNLSRLLRDGTIRSRVRQRIGGTVLERLCGDAGAARVRAIEAGNA